MIRWWRLLGLACAATACLHVKSPQCDDGRVCAENEVCAPFGGCVTPEQLTACAGQDELSPCALAGVAGVCRAGLCKVVACGNGVLDPGEVCDDGNVVSGDGCRADCQKLEVCGDGVVDQNEVCDDTNDNPSDGCDQCRTTGWTVAASVGIGSACTLSGLGCPIAVAIDSAGTRYVADHTYNRVFRVTAGVPTLIAGDASGASGATGDGAAATAALLMQPAGLALDTNGDLYIADTGNDRIRMISAVDGVIRNVAGSTFGFAGINGQPAATARFRGPRGLYLDTTAHVLYVADAGNHVVRAIDLSSGVAAATISTIAGTAQTFGNTGDGSLATAAFLCQPSAVIRCSNGDLFIADTCNNAVRRVNAMGIVTRVLGDAVAASSGQGMPAHDFPADAPLGLGCDARGNVFVSSSTTVRVLAERGGVVDGTGVVLNAGLFACTDPMPGGLGGVTVLDDRTVVVVHACTGTLVDLQREIIP